MLCRCVIALLLVALPLAACDKDHPTSPSGTLQSGPPVSPDPTASAPQSIEGSIESINAPDTIVIAGQPVAINQGTVIRMGSTPLSFADLRVGTRARVAAQRDGGGTLRSSQVDVIDGVGTPIATHGVIQGFSGDGSGFRFNFGSQSVRGDGNTRITDGGQAASADVLRDGVSADVNGLLLSTGLQASTIAIDSASQQAGPPVASPSPGGPSPSPGLGGGNNGSDVTVTGVLGPLSGLCPVLNFPISGQAVVTNAATAFIGGSCSGLNVGATVEVTGTPSGNVIVARTITVR